MSPAQINPRDEHTKWPWDSLRGLPVYKEPHLLRDVRATSLQPTAADSRKKGCRVVLSQTRGHQTSSNLGQVPRRGFREILRKAKERPSFSVDFRAGYQ